MHTQMEAVLEFLSSVPDPTGKPALQFVVSEWCSKHYLFYGSYDQKIRSLNTLSSLMIVLECYFIVFRILQCDWSLQDFDARHSNERQSSARV